MVKSITLIDDDQNILTSLSIALKAESLKLSNITLD